MADEINKTGEIIIYKNVDGPEIKVSLVDDTVWLNQSQMAELFSKDRDTISEHIKNVYKEAELSQNRTTRKFRAVQKEGKRQVERQVEFYNIDMIISVGYRVNSKRGTQFRIWATQRLKDYLLKGYAINQQRLEEHSTAKVKELQGAISLFQNAVQNNRLEGYEKDVLNIIIDYASTWATLYQYDEDSLALEKGTKKSVSALDYDKVNKAINSFRLRLMKNKQASDLFGKEVGDKLKALLGNVEQTYNSKALYQTLEEKAAHLLYFAIKDHPFADGNKRIGSLMFLLYLVENNRVYNRKGERIISDNALTAIALLVAESKPDQKQVMVQLIANLISKK